MDPGVSYHPLSPTVQSQQCNRAAQKHETATAELGDIRAWSSSEKPAWLVSFVLFHCTLVLEKHVVFKGNGTEPREYRAPVKVVGIRPEPVDNVVI